MIRALVLAVLLVPAPFLPAFAAAETDAKHPVDARHPAQSQHHVATPVVQPPKHTHAQKPPHHAAPVKPVPAPPPQAPAPAPEPVPPPPKADPAKGTVTGLPLPRFAALRTDDVNLRAGPGTRYPIDWVYKRRDLPVQIEREFEVWRLVRDPDGIKGWVHQATLVGRRDFIVTGEERVLRHDANDKSDPVARLKPGVIGRVRSCDASEYCEVQVGDYRGFLKRSEFWGTYDGEVVGG